MSASLDLAAAALFHGGGEMGERMRAFDWAATSLGPVARWPESLKTCVRIILTSRQPMFVWWGEELINLYNDAYRSIVGGKHPWALAQPASAVWREIWDQVLPRAQRAMRGNEGTYDEALLLIMERNGYQEETYYTFSYSPVPNERGGTGGIICANTDDTQRIIGERRMAVLRELAARTVEARRPEDACSQAAAALAEDDRDLPFALVYLNEPGTDAVLLAGAAGVAPGQAVAPHRLTPITSGGATVPWPVFDVLRDHAPRVVEDLSSVAAALPLGPWRVAPSRAVVWPLIPRGQSGRAGALVVALNPYRLYDEEYRSFVGLVAGQIVASVASAQAYEQERQRAEALAELDRAKTAFFSNVSHEFRTPLTLMLGPEEDALASPEGALAGEALQGVHRNTLRLLKLVNNLLDFSRIEAGRAQARYQPTDLAGLTVDLASAFRSAIERGGVRFDVDCPSLVESVFVDRGMWETIVLNLLSNAFKFTLSGRIAIGLKSVGRQAVLSVTDTGVGIPEHELPRMFERFHRIETEETRTHEGSGIGLALVAELVRLHGGAIRVTSRLRQGTTFTVSLPLGRDHLPPERVSAVADRRDSALERANPFVQEALRWVPAGESGPDDSIPVDEAPPTRAAAGLVLVADDNADMRAYLARLLRDHWAVETVGDGEQALAAARERQPDLILTDAMMPKRDGFGLLQQVRADPRLARTPVIILSARAGEESRVEGLEAGADDYLVKPFQAKELVARVRGHLESARLRRAAETERNRLSGLLGQLPAIVNFLRGPELIIDFAHPLTIAALGGRQLLGKPLEEAIPEFSSQEYPRLIRRVFETGERIEGHESLVRLQDTTAPRGPARDVLELRLPARARRRWQHRGGDDLQPRGDRAGPGAPRPRGQECGTGSRQGRGRAGTRPGGDSQPGQGRVPGHARSRAAKPAVAHLDGAAPDAGARASRSRACGDRAAGGSSGPPGRRSAGRLAHHARKDRAAARAAGAGHRGGGRAGDGAAVAGAAAAEADAGRARERPDRARRRQPPGPDRVQPADERGEVQRPRDRHRGDRATRGGPGVADCPRSGGGDTARHHRSHLRRVLPGAAGDRSLEGRPGPGPGHRPQSGGSSRRPGVGPQRRRESGQRVHGRAAAGGGGAVREGGRDSTAGGPDAGRAPVRPSHPAGR